MVVDEDDGRSLAAQRPDGDLAWVDQRCRERADTDEVQADHDVLAVEKQDPKVFAIQVRDQRRHQVGYVLALAHLTVPRRGDAAVLHHEQPIARHAVRHRRVSTSSVLGDCFAHTLTISEDARAPDAPTAAISTAGTDPARLSAACTTADRTRPQPLAATAAR